MKTVSAVLIAHNEEEKIAAALESVRPIADEIVVIDSFSDDRTAEISSRFTERVIRRTWPGYRPQKQFAAEQAACDWVLSIDADEQLSPELQDEIRQWKTETEESRAGYFLPRKTFFMGRWIEHTTWYPDWQLRLYDRIKGSWEGGRVHESVRVNGTTGRFSGDLYHYSYTSVSEFLRQLERFSDLAARDDYELGERSGFFRLALQPPAVFLQNYLLRLGFLDGKAGLAVSSLSAVSVFFKYLKLWELQLNNDARERLD